jgi:hypothetical protein
MLIVTVYFLLCISCVKAQQTVSWETIENRLHQLVLEFAEHRKTYSNETEIFEIDEESGFLYHIMYQPFERCYYMSLFLIEPTFLELSFPGYYIEPEQRQHIISEAASRFKLLYEETRTEDFWYCSLSSSWYNWVRILRDQETILFLSYENSL